MNTRHDSLFAAFGGISAEDNSTATTIAGSSTDFSNKAQVEVFDTDQDAENMTPENANDHIVIDKRGKYQIDLQISLLAAAADELSGAVFKNNGATQVGPRFSATVPAAGDACHANVSVIAELSRGDTLEAWIQNESQTADITVTDVSLTAKLVKYIPGR